MSEENQAQLKLSPEHLIEEYKANVELWKHDDSLRQQRIGNFLTANTVLITALGALITISSFSSALGIVSVLLSTFGFSISYVWYFVSIRNANYIRLRRLVFQEIESNLSGLSTFTIMHRAFGRSELITFEKTGETFSVSKHAKQSSTTLENRLPLIMQVFWSLVFLSGTLQIFFFLHHR
ncbi:MAG: hypothetical protein HY961_18945 [Ignavibacteriae bacterium]|nr:hypothetical protein [Ignavibacteriota bacterium]